MSRIDIENGVKIGYEVLSEYPSDGDSCLTEITIDSDGGNFGSYVDSKGKTHLVFRGTIEFENLRDGLKFILNKLNDQYNGGNN
ncbi:hypothetical protein [Companilactobacillus bobalius]|uniref:Uncharacterized protein n=1 Tax=Companilactobacillus bobalius TaxID=2801451 RepID=A0A202F5W5_9LACO|nr:hypothetical protein [Companilactobacillus bobalius]KAE9560680.1 hypothetical protein ATN92_11130 [Companilactobacillus bobalius]OVE95810.1 hypothetical protein LKACC16343_02562 [Companilactobacillus bobalius]GEO59338.1 hypothetical protein LBO01_24670 [Companilactobacillus paralimentarius]